MEIAGLFISFALIFPWLVLSACILLALDFIMLLKAKGKKSSELAFIAFSIAFVIVVASYVMLTQSFVSDFFSLKEVYTYSSSGLTLPYKVGGPWIGSSGSMLFVTFFLVLVYFVFRFKGLEKESESRTTTYKILDIFLIFLLLVTLLQSPFERLPIVPPDGAGLNPLLQTFWVLVHPPVIFLGYVFVFFAFALTLAGMITGEKEELRAPLKCSLYAAWLFLALGIALGGWWSYEVLGWGGYWAWDPVETASLLPWFALTAYFHLPPKSKDLAKEFTLMVSFVMIIFATALTRGGLLESVHAFGKSPVGPVLLGFGFCVLLYFVYLAIRSKKPLYSFDIDTSSLHSVSILVAYWSLMFLLIICFFGDAAPIVGGIFSENTMSATGVEFYNRWCFPFTLAFVAALLGCNVALKLERYLMLIVAVLGIGLVLALLGLPTPNPLTNFGLPLLLVAGFAIAYNSAKVMQKRNSLHLWGKTLIHLAVIIILLGVFFSAVDAAKDPRSFVAEPNSTIDILGTQMEFGNFTIYTGMGRVYYPQHLFVGPEYSALKVDALIKEGGDVHQGVLWMYHYANHGIVSEPLIISTLAGDLYVSMHPTVSSYNSSFYAIMGVEVQPEDFVVKVKKIPLIWVLWFGIVLMSIGMVVLLVGELKRKK
ncbi:MAG: cytochrome c biogenesis protein CcsA [Halobacteriota archaeon]